MDKKRSLLNVSVSIIFRFLLLFASLLTRRTVIQFIGNEINGINSLYSSIIGMLSVAELGVGSAITFCMYKPIADGDNGKVSALFSLFRRAYLIVGGVIATGGICVMPFLPYLAKNYNSESVNLYLTFGLLLASVVMSYMFSSKVSLINAYKDNYITTTISSSCTLLQYVLQMVVVILFKSFALYLLCHLGATVVHWVLIDIISKKKYVDILNPSEKLNKETKHDVVKRIKAMFMHKIGSVLVNSADNMIISAFIGVSVLGLYSNYTVVMVGMVSIITLFFTPLTSIIGLSYVKDRGNSKKYYDFFYTVNFIIGMVFFLGYFAVIDNLVSLLFGSSLIMPRYISIVITTNYFIQFMRNATSLFKDATGVFYNDRWKPLLEGVLNIVLSIAFVLIFPKEYKVVGVIVATILTNLFVCHTIEPYVVCRYAFGTSAKKYFTKNYVYISVFIFCLFLFDKIRLKNHSILFELFTNGLASIAMSGIVILLIIVFDKQFRKMLSKAFIQVQSKKLKRM